MRKSGSTFDPPTYATTESPGQTSISDERLLLRVSFRRFKYSSKSPFETKQNRPVMRAEFLSAADSRSNVAPRFEYPPNFSGCGSPIRVRRSSSILHWNFHNLDSTFM